MLNYNNNIKLDLISVQKPLFILFYVKIWNDASKG